MIVSNVTKMVKKTCKPKNKIIHTISTKKCLYQKSITSLYLAVPNLLRSFTKKLVWKKSLIWRRDGRGIVVWKRFDWKGVE